MGEDKKENNQVEPAAGETFTVVNKGPSIDIPKLTGKNYLNWKSVMSDIITLKGLQAVVFGDSKDPTLNLHAKILIKGNLDEHHLAEVRSHEDARDIWSHLSRMCIGANSSDLTLLVRKFYNYQYEQGDSMVTLLEKLTTMRQQLKNVDQDPTDEVFIDRVLQTLPPEFDRLKENWDYLHPSQRNIDELKARVLKIEDDSKAKGSQEVAQAFLAKPFGDMSIDEKKKNSNCAKCGLRGHWARECRTKPENYKKQAKGDEDTKTRSYKQQTRPSRASEDKSGDVNPLDVIFMTSDVRSLKVALPQSNNIDGVPLVLKDQWLVDSGASSHVCNNRSWFNQFTPVSAPRSVRVGDDSEAAILGFGRVAVQCFMGDTIYEAMIERVLFVPSMAANLISVGRLDDKGIATLFTGKEVKLITNKQVVAKGSLLTSRLYLMDIRAKQANKEVALFCQAKRSIEDWHRTLGHASKERIVKLLDDAELGVRATNRDDRIDCSDCPPGKGKNASHPSLNRRADEVGDRVFVDLSGPHMVTVNGSQYFLLCKDEHSTFTYAYCLKDKAHLDLALAKLFTEFEIETGKRVVRLHSDKGGEFFTSTKTEILCAIEHVMQETSAEYTPQQNGMIEREIGSVTAMARTMLLSSNLTRTLWDEAIKTACFIRNRLPNKNIETTPYEVAVGRKPQIAHLCEFGREVHVIVHGHHLTKFEPRTEPGYIVGFTQRSNTYRVYLKERGRVIESCNVIFRPHKQMPQSTTPTPTERSRVNLDKYFDDLLASGGDNESTLDDFLTADEQCNDQGDSDMSEITSPPFSPMTVTSDQSTLDQSEVAMIAMSPEIAEPSTFNEAICSPQRDSWRQAIAEEFEAHEKNGTWVVVDKPSDRQPMSTKWVFKLKRCLDGTVDRFKARLVARGFEQRYGRDFNETFAPVARYDSIRTLIAIAAQLNLKITQFDVATAFLHGILEENVFILPPEGMDLPAGKVLKLLKGLYGLKQSPRVWNNRFKEELEQMGFSSLASDSCVYKHKHKPIFMCVYVDDCLCLAPEEAQLGGITDRLMAAFKIRIVKNSTFVGLEISQTPNGYFVSQQAFAKKVLERFHMLDSLPVTAPLIVGHKLMEPDDSDEQIECPYREAIGSLLFLAANTRPDILHATTLLAKFCSKPNRRHWEAVLRVMRYIRGSHDKGLLFERTATLAIEAFTDADWASDASTRKSITGTMIKMAGGPIIFRSNQQTLVALSTTEAEFVAGAESVRDLTWLRSLLKELQIDHRTPTLYCDSQTAIRCIMNPEFPRRTKHIDIKYHFIRDQFSKQIFKLEYIRTEEQLADFLTKAIGREQFHKLVRNSNILSLTNDSGSSERGGVLAGRSSHETVE